MVPGWNLERGPISNEEKGGPHILGFGPLNGVTCGCSVVTK